MQLNKVKLGNYIEPYEERNYENEYDESSVRGIATSKNFIYTKANLDGVSLTSYKLVKPQMFAYVPDTSRRGDKISLAYNNSSETYLVSSISVIFTVREDKQEELLSDYLYIFFNRPEFDRYARFNSWGSAREPFNWEDMCEVEIELPDIEIQQKYVDIYMGLKENIETYKDGIHELNNTCVAIIEKLLKTCKKEKIGRYINEEDSRNSDLQYSIKYVRGISINKQFINTKANMEGVALNNYKIVKHQFFAFNPNTSRNGEKISLSLNLTETPYLVSSVYTTFSISEDLLPEYLFMWLSRPEFDRYARYNSWGSAREMFSLEDLGNLKLPVPNIEIQQSTINIFKTYIERSEQLELLKQIQKNICPILIKGSVEEAKKCEVASIG